MGPPEPDDTGPPPAQRPRSVVTISRSSPHGRPSRQQPAQDAHAGDVAGVPAPSLLPSQSTGTCTGPAPLVGHAASAAPQPVRMPSGGPGLPWTLVRATHGQRWTIPSPPGPVRAATTKPLADHGDTPNPGAPTVAGPPQRRPGSSAVRTARLQRPRTPNACLSGHPGYTGRPDTGRPDTGRPPDQVGRTSARRRANADRATNGVAGVRTPRRPRRRRSPAQRRKPRLGCSVCGARRPMRLGSDDRCRRGAWAAAQHCSTSSRASAHCSRRSLEGTSRGSVSEFAASSARGLGDRKVEWA
jgi:hypothetical protein